MRRTLSTGPKISSLHGVLPGWTYCNERSKLPDGGPTFKELRDGVPLNDHIRHALELLGQAPADGAGIPIHYPATPQMTQEPPETDHFRWFVANYHAGPNQQTLPPLDVPVLSLPPLDRE